MGLNKADFNEILSIIEHWNSKDNANINSITNQKFKNWSGVTINAFQQHIQQKYLQRKLNVVEEQPSLFNIEVSTQTKLGPSIEIKRWKAKDDDLEITYSFEKSLFGELLIASTSKGICWLAFSKNRETSRIDLQGYFPQSIFREDSDIASHSTLASYLFLKQNVVGTLSLHLKGSEFQYQVWSALLEIDLGCLTSYGAIAKSIGLPVGASRAVGTAIGKNNIAFIIPCHRIIRRSGVIGAYKWGSTLKRALIGWEML